MTWLQIVVLAIVQGLTEFLPVSSSAHLILAGQLLQWPDQGLGLDVAVHLGTLLAVVFYFRADLTAMLLALTSKGSQRSSAQEQQRRLGLILLCSSLPVLVVGAIAYDFVAYWLRDLRIIAWATLIFGLLLWLADRFAPARYEIRDITLARGLAIGLAQVLALVPGTSRSGVTMTMARLLGFQVSSAARFSFLLSIPVIAFAGLHGVWLLGASDGGVAWQPFGLAVALAALAGWVCIAAFLALLQRVGLLPFIVYRVLLGLVLLYLVY